MNGYTKILAQKIEEAEKNYDRDVYNNGRYSSVRKARAWARIYLAAVEKGWGYLTKRDHAELDRIDMNKNWFGHYEFSEIEQLAVLSIVKDRTPEQVTTQLFSDSQAVTALFLRAQENGYCEVWRVAPPYQIAFYF